MQNADFSPLRGLGTDTFWLSFVEKKGAVKASMIDYDALMKMITQDPRVCALASLIKTMEFLGGNNELRGNEFLISRSENENDNVFASKPLSLPICQSGT